MDDQSTVHIQPSNQSTQTSSKTILVIIFTILILSLGLNAWLAYMVYFQTLNNNFNSLTSSKLNQILEPSISPTNEPITTPTTMPMPTSTTSINVESSYREVIDKLQQELSTWDNTFVITSFSATFADTLDQAKKLRSGENTNYPDSFRIVVYSTSKDVSRVYRYILKDRRIAVEGADIDLSKTRPKGILYSSDRKLPSISIQSALDRCFSYAVNQPGIFYLHSCTYNTDYLGLNSSLSGWVCDFIEERAAENKEYLYEADNYLCGIGELPDSVVTWTASGPPPVSR